MFASINQVAASVPFEPTMNNPATDVQQAIENISNIIASGIRNYQLVSSTLFSTTSTTYVAITNFNVTPQAGKYAVWYNSYILYTTTPILHYWAFFKAGVIVQDSERTQTTSRSNQEMVDVTMSVIEFNGSEVLDVRVKRGTSGRYDILDRTLILIRLED
jgi:hypothetical protein